MNNVNESDRCEIYGCPLVATAFSGERAVCKGHSTFTPKENSNMVTCTNCSFKSLETLDGLCEKCFRTEKIDPLLRLRRVYLNELSMVDTKLTAALEKLTLTSHHNLNLSFTCVCGQVHKSGLEMLNHLPDCPGAVKAPTHRNGFVRKIALDDIPEEIG